MPTHATPTDVIEINCAPTEAKARLSDTDPEALVESLTKRKKWNPYKYEHYDAFVSDLKQDLRKRSLLTFSAKMSLHYFA